MTELLIVLPVTVSTRWPGKARMMTVALLTPVRLTALDRVRLSV